MISGSPAVQGAGSGLANKLLIGRAALLGGGGGPVYLLLDRFTTDEAAPLTSPRTCEPGPGTLTLKDTSDKLSISGGRLIQATNEIENYVDPQAISQTGLARAAGLAVYALSKVVTSNMDLCGFSASTTPVSQGNFSHFLYQEETQLRVRRAGALQLNVHTVAVGTDYETAIVLRDAGAFFLLKISSAWTLLWVDPTAAAASVYPFVCGGLSTTAGECDTLAAFQLSSPWTTDFGIATQRLSGARAAGDTFTHEGNCLIEFTVTTIPSADQIEVRFRVQDADNYWQVTIDSTGAMELDEVVAGTPTQRGAAAGVVANGDRIVIIAAAGVIRVFEANTVRITYSSATNFQTETDGELETEGTGGSVSDIVAWPRTLSGAALAELEKYA